jgi:hypothetical protein
MKTVLALLTITLALTSSVRAQTAEAKIINDRCYTIAHMIMPAGEAAAKIADNPRSPIADREAALQNIADLLKLTHGVCAAKTLPDSDRAVEALSKWAEEARDAAGKTLAKRKAGQ